MEYNILEYIFIAGIIWVGFRPVRSSDELGLGIVAFTTESMENQFSRRHIWSLDLRRYYFIILVIFYNKAKEYILYYLLLIYLIIK